MRRPGVQEKHCPSLLPSPSPEFCLPRMTSVLKLFRDILCRLGSSRGVFHRFFRHWALFLAFLGRRLGVWRLWDDRKRGAFPIAKQAGWSPPCTKSSLDVIVAASSIPESASHPSLRDVWSASQQPAASSGIPPSNQDHAEPSSALDTSCRYTDSNIHSRFGDRPSIIHASQSTQFPADLHRQLGRGAFVLPPEEHPSRSPSPADRLPQLPHLDTDVTHSHPLVHVDDRKGPITPPSTASHSHAVVDLPCLHGHRGRQSSPSPSVVVGVVDPSTDLRPPRRSSIQLPLTDEPYTIGSPIVPDAASARKGPPRHSPVDSSPSATSNLELPEGRFLQLINSEQVPRYTKEVTVQVTCITTTIKPLSRSYRPRERTYYEIPPLTTTFL